MDKNGPLGVRFTERDRSKGVLACSISLLEGTVGEKVQLSTLIDGAGHILLLLEDVVDGHRQARTRSTSIELASSLAPAPTTGIERVTAVHRARSRDHFRTSHVHRSVSADHARSSSPPGHK